MALLWLAACSRGSTSSPLRYVIDAPGQQTRFYAGEELLAVYNNAGNTFTEFRVHGMNVLGGYAPGANGTNDGPPVAGHPAPYPFGQIGGGTYSQWEGFWAGYNYVDMRWGAWTGVNGNPEAVGGAVAVRVLEKPYGPAEILARVRACLDESTTGT